MYKEKTLPPSSPPREATQLLDADKVEQLDTKSRSLYFLIVQYPEHNAHWTYDKYHVETFGREGACSLERAIILDVIDSAGGWISAYSNCIACKFLIIIIYYCFKFVVILISL